MLRASAACLAAAAAAPLVVGCVARTRGEVVYGHPVVEAEYVPARIEYYPRVYYRGSYAYYVDGRWYYPSPRAQRGWVVFRDEPRQLRRYRIDGRWDRGPRRRERIPHRRRAPELGSPRERRRRRYPR